MNSRHLEIVFDNYARNFDLINNPIHYENYKWEVVWSFQDKFDLEAEDFCGMLRNLGEATGNLIDNERYKPFEALVSFAEIEPETVRGMFRSLYEDDNGNMFIRQKKINEFISASERLRLKYLADDPWCINDLRSAMAFLFFHDPEHNYMYRGTEGREFADCIEFHHDWHTGEEFKLDVYYRMCDELVKHIRNSQALLDVNKQRFSFSDKPMYDDPSYHLLAFDIIFCSITYDLFEGIEYQRSNLKTRRIVHAMRKQAQDLYKELIGVENMLNELEKAKQYFSPLFTVGREVKHKAFGNGIIKEVDDTSAIIFFPKKNSEKKFGILTAAAGGFITIDEPDYKSKIKQYKNVILREGEIVQHLSLARRQMAKYTAYLE